MEVVEEVSVSFQVIVKYQMLEEMFNWNWMEFLSKKKN